MNDVEVVVVGAGPAGLNAALFAANRECKVVLIDSASRPGGQYWRHLPMSQESLNETLHYDFAKGRKLLDSVRDHPNILVMNQSQVWNASVTDQGAILRVTSTDDRGRREQIEYRTARLILATGAYDRSLPFPGWDIPGVMTPGAAQALLKGNGVLAGAKMVVAGSGPFLLPVASSLAEQGVEIVELLEANSPLGWNKHLPVLMGNPSKLREARYYLRTLAQHGVKMKYKYAVIEAHAHGEGQVVKAGTLKGVTIAKVRSDFRVITGSARFVACDALAVGWGFTPDTSIASALGLKQRVSSDGSVEVFVDQGLRAYVDSDDVIVFAAGEITGVGGSGLSLTEGAIAGLSCALSLNRISMSEFEIAAKKFLRAKGRAAKFASALRQVYRIGDGWSSWLRPSTVMCRCEEVVCRQIDDAIEELGAISSRDVKLFTRAGMGMCQGRICGRNIADYLHSDDEDRIRSTYRPIIAPVTLGELAQEPLL